jgi:hypothetical protein
VACHASRSHLLGRVRPSLPNHGDCEHRALLSICSLAIEGVYNAKLTTDAPGLLVPRVNLVPKEISTQHPSGRRRGPALETRPFDGGCDPTGWCTDSLELRSESVWSIYAPVMLGAAIPSFDRANSIADSVSASM